MSAASRSPAAPVVLVKLCGTARAEDLDIAYELSVDLVGFVFFDGSPRRANAIDVGAWRRAHGGARTAGPRFAGVFVNAALDEIARARDAADLDLIQLHGDETPEFCRAVARIAPVVKAIRLAGPESLAALDAFDRCHAILVEPAGTGARGGAGVPLDLHVAALAARRGRVLLAGGLRPETVAAAIRAVRPYAVDVASGVESAPGRRDRTMAAAFVAAARGAIAAVDEPPSEPRGSGA